MNFDSIRRLRPTVVLMVIAGLTLAAMSGAATRRAASTDRPLTPRYPHARAKVSFSLYQDLLNQHLWVTSKPGEPLETRFNYELFYDEKGRGEREYHIRQQFLDTDPASLDDANRIAWAINFYNYMVIERITDNLLIPGKKRQRYLSVRDIHSMGQDFFKTNIVKVDTTNYTLDEFERHFLFNDANRQPKPSDLPKIDPRIHFALVCGAMGCPPLQPRAFRADSLDIQLDDGVRAALATPAHFAQLENSPVMRISAIFYWYPGDFGGMSHVMPFILRYLPAKERAEAEKFKDRPRFSQIQWDWNLNQVVGWRFQYMMDRPMSGSAGKDSS